MKIAVVSDTHNNIANFKKAIDWIKNPPSGEAGEKISLILHCGDISSQETIDEAVKYFGDEIKFVKGNADWQMDLPEKMEIEIEGKKVAFCHFPDMAKKLAQSGNYDVVFYGHTHRPWDEKITCLPCLPDRQAVGREETHMINLGELAGQFYKPCFAVYDTATGLLELKILEKL